MTSESEARASPVPFAWPDWAAHVTDQAGRLQALAPRVFAAMGAHATELLALQSDIRARQAALWQNVNACSVSAVTQTHQTLPFFRLASEQHQLLREASERFVDLLALDRAEARSLRFALKQWVEAAAPENFLATNPQAIERALRSEYQSLKQGQETWRRDLARGKLRMCDEAAFVVGRNLATTAGAVVYENELIQLIQYASRTPRVYRTPLLIFPPFINKYYVLDLSEHNSFVKYALDAGLQTFIVSWRDIDGAHGTLTWDDYALLGVKSAMQVTQEITGAAGLHVLGFCVGGTLLSSALASCVDTQSVKSLTLLASLLDFSDVGDIAAYIDEPFVLRTEQQYSQGGVVAGAQLAAAFASLRPRELIWQYVVQNYLLGDTPRAFDMLYWNSDGANLPGPLFAWYLRQCYLENNLREAGAVRIAGHAVDLARLRMPSFVLGAQADHIVPWQSAYNSARLLPGNVEFCLAASGHIAGILSPPGSARRSYRTGPLLGLETVHWLAQSTSHEGSWWPHWTRWLVQHAKLRKAAPQHLGTQDRPPIEPAPGRYVKSHPIAH